MSTLEARVRAMEDRLEIIDLIAGYGPAVDSGDEEAVARMWAQGGEYTFGAASSAATTLTGREVGALVDLPGHRSYMDRGCGHVLTTPRVSVDGDEATAFNHSLLVLHDGQRWVIERASSNRWELERINGRWQVRRRINALLDGAPEAFGLFNP